MKKPSGMMKPKLTGYTLLPKQQKMATAPKMKMGKMTPASAAKIRNVATRILGK